IKHGSHIMLQRLVRSTVSTEPRPYLMVELPWLRSLLLGASKSRPGNRPSMRAMKEGSTLMTSENSPCLGQVFNIRIWPSRSKISALIAPGLPSTNSRRSSAPERTASRTSFTQRGQSESVVRGQPSCGAVRSFFRKSGAGAHLGCRRPPGKRSLYFWYNGQTRLTALPTSFSVSRVMRSRALCMMPRAYTDPCLDQEPFETRPPLGSCAFPGKLSRSAACPPDAPEARDDARLGEIMRPRPRSCSVHEALHRHQCLALVGGCV